MSARIYTEMRKQLDMLNPKTKLEWYAANQTKIIRDFEAIDNDQIPKMYHVLKQMPSEITMENETRSLKFGRETFDQFNKRMEEKGYRTI